MKKVIILFGGVSPEHEVSVITGLQVFESINRKFFTPHAVSLTQDGIFHYYEGLNNKKDYLRIKPKLINFGKDAKGAFFQTEGLLKNKIYIDIAFLAFHGGNGEGGQLQGFLETLNIPFTSPDIQTSVIAMNKALTKEVLNQNGIDTLKYLSLTSLEIQDNPDSATKKVLSSLKLPLIIKPAHLGSSIGINIAKTKVELKKYLLEASHIDSEILIENYLANFKEYNVAVRKVNQNIEASEVEKPLSKDEILSFADKYQRGGKKSGGMASLNRELPAKIPTSLKKELQQKAIGIFKIIRAKGMIRIDFIVTKKNIYVTEINPIPGSMAYYLWEATGISFTDQITDLLNQAIIDNEYKNSKNLAHKSDIIENFIKGNSAKHRNTNH